MSADIVNSVDGIIEDLYESGLDNNTVASCIRDLAAEIVRLRGEVDRLAELERSNEVFRELVIGEGAWQRFQDLERRTKEAEARAESIAPAEAKGDATLSAIIGSMRNFADVAERCDVTNAAPAIRNWADMLADYTPQPSDGGAVAWLPPTEVPCVKYGSYGFFWVAVRRAHNGKIYSFPAAYLNEMGLTNDDDEPVISVSRGNHWIELPPVDDEFTMLATGWYSAKEQHGDDLFQPLLDSTDELVAWRAVADYPLGDTGYTHPPAAQVQECHMRGRCECIGACKYGLGGNGAALECPACRLEAALQHRGDSRGGEG